MGTWGHQWRWGGWVRWRHGDIKEVDWGGWGYGDISGVDWGGWGHGDVNEDRGHEGGWRHGDISGDGVVGVDGDMGTSTRLTGMDGDMGTSMGMG